MPLLSGSVLAQQNITQQQIVKSVGVGEVLPAAFWAQSIQVLQKGVARKINLSLYKGKTVLIDFWASWCSSVRIGLILLRLRP